MCPVILLLAEAGAGSAGAPSGPIREVFRSFGVDWPHLIAQTISFGIVCLLLYWFAYQPVLKTLQQRRERIAEGLANAEKARAELAKAEAQRREAMAQASAQATRFIEEARAAAARVQQEETQKALAAAEKIMAEAREASRQDHERMLGELKREMGRLVAQTTAAVIGTVLSPEDQRRLAEQTIAAVAAETPEQQPQMVGAGAANGSPNTYPGANGQ